MDPEVGSSYGPYVVEEVIARGGQGLVLRARHSQHGVPAALKILLDKREQERGRFKREIETLRLLSDHPGLPKPYDLGEHEGTLFIALEFVEGSSLHDLVRSGGTLPEEEALALVAKIARIVAQCHERGVLHRDLKPANVLVRAESGAPCVVDFGVARVEGVGVSEQSRLSMTGDLIGTPAFMAPEQVSGEGVGPRTDVYGLGAILYFLLSGERPFSGPTALNVMTRLARDPTPDVRAANPAVSAPTAELLLEAMAKEPGGRIQTAAGFAERLEDLVATGVSPQSGGGRGGLVLGLLALLALGGVLGVGAALALGEPSPSPASSAAPSPTASQAPPTAGPAASTSPSASPPPRATASQLPLQAPGSETWSRQLPSQALTSVRAMGPSWAVVETHPVAGGKVKRGRADAQLVSLADGKRGAQVPRARLWCWDDEDQRLLGHDKGRLFSVSLDAIEGPPVQLAEGLGELCTLAASGGRIYTSRPGRFEIRDSAGVVQRSIEVAGHVETPPLELDLDHGRAGPDHLLLLTSASDAILLSLDGRVRARTLLPAPVTDPPAVLAVKPGNVKLGLVSGAGVLVRLRVEPGSLRVRAANWIGRAGRRLLEPRGPLLVGRDPQGRARQVYLHLYSGIACFSPELAELRWRAVHPSGRGQEILTGLALSNLDRSGAPELLATFLRPGPRGPGLDRSHLLFNSQGYVISAGPTHAGLRSGEALPDGFLLSSARDTLVRWGPWSRLPDADPALNRVPERGGPLAPAKPVSLDLGTTKKLPLRKTAELEPLTVGFEPGRRSPVAVGGKGVESVWLAGQVAREKRKGLSTNAARIDVNFLTMRGERATGPAFLELELQVRNNFGPAFAELAFVVNDRRLERTYRAFHNQSHLRIPLGDLKGDGLCAVQAYITRRTRVMVRIKRLRLTFGER